MRSAPRAPGMRRGVFALCALVLVGALAGCTPEDVRPTPTASPSTTPLFASDEEALAAATKAYAAYLKMSDTIAHDGGADPERIKPYATKNALSAALKSAAQYKEADAHGSGETQFHNATFANSVDQPPYPITIYVCDDVAAVDVVDASGQSLVKPDRPTLTAFQVVVERSSSDKNFVVANKEVWSSGGVCK